VIGSDDGRGAIREDRSHCRYDGPTRERHNNDPEPERPKQPKKKAAPKASGRGKFEQYAASNAGEASR
jgi:hypothetical protein